MPRDTVGHTFKVALLLCVVCSVLVSGAAVGLRERQQANKERDRKKNILIAAGLWEADQPPAAIDELYRERIVERIVELETGRFTDAVDPQTYEQARAARVAQLSEPIPAAADVARVRRREKYSFVYLVKDEREQVDQVVLPIRGYGLWSTLWGFLSLDAASIAEGPAEITIRGITYYDHGETPGLGDQVDRQAWQRQWDGKRLYDDQWRVRMRVAKGTVAPDDPQARFRVDGLSGATITANGVSNMIEFWFGEQGFRSFLQSAHERPEMLAAEGVSDG